MATPFGTSGSAPRSKNLFVVIFILAIGAGASCYFYYSEKEKSNENLKAAFDSEAAARFSAASALLSHHLAQIDSVRRFVTYDSNVTEKAFLNFATPATRQLPGIRSMMWAPRVTREGRVEFEQKMRREGLKDFTIQTLPSKPGETTPAPAQSLHFPIVYCAPAEVSPTARGLDAAVHTPGDDTLEKATITGKPAASHATKITNPFGKGAACVVASPVYPENFSFESGEDPKQQLRGYIISSINLQLLFTDIFKNLREGYLCVQVVDAPSAGAPEILFQQDYDSGVGAAPRREFPIEFADRRWLIQMAAAAPFLTIHSDRRPWFVLLAGLSITFTAAFYFYLRAGKYHKSREEATNRLETIVDHAPICLKMMDRNGVILDMNEAGLRIAEGESLDQVRNQPIWKFLVATEHEPFREALRACALGEEQKLTFEIRTFKGKRKFISSQLTPIFSKSDRKQVSSILAVSRDITVERETEMALRESETRYKSVVRALDEGIIVISPEGTFLTWNESASRILGFEFSDLDTRTTNSPEWNVIREDGTRFPMELFPNEVTLKTGVAMKDVVMGVRRKDGSLVWISANTQPIYAEGSVKPVSVVGSFRDITNKRAAEATLRERERRLRMFFEIPLVGMALSSIDRGLIEVNDRLCNILGYTRDELLAKSWTEFIHPDDLSASLQLFNKMLAGAIDGYTLRKRYIRRDGKIVHALSSTRGILNNDGAESFIVTMIQDITAIVEAEEEHRNMERKIRETQKLESLGVLAGGVAHDFNNILTGILGSASLAKMQSEKGTIPTVNMEELLSRIEAASLRAADLCRQLLAYSGRSQMILEETDLSRVVTDTLQLLNASIRKNVSIGVEAAPALPPVFADRDQLRQIIMNLAINAAEAIGNNPGNITIRTGIVNVDADLLQKLQYFGDLKLGEYVYFEVSDNGCGMAPETQARAFEPFFTTKFTGRGLGLSAVLGIVRSHHGAVRVQSAPGKGSTVTVILPTINLPLSGQAAIKTTNPPVGEIPGVPSLSGTALVIDDEPDVREVLVSTLKMCGMTVLQAPDGARGADIFKEHRDAIDIVFTDATMPGMEGDATARTIRGMSSKVKIILMSGYRESELIGKFNNIAISGFMEKPFRPSDVYLKLKNVLDAKS